MLAQFIGGPLDGIKMDHTQINAAGMVVPIFAETGWRQFVFMPSFADCERIWKGEVVKDLEGTPTRSIYERFFLPGGGAEYRHKLGAYNEAVESALRRQQNGHN
jgi:hypothetical protein